MPPSNRRYQLKAADVDRSELVCYTLALRPEHVRLPCSACGCPTANTPE